jgi:hypothetical protein
VGGTPSCGDGLGSDVWYTAEVPASGNLAIETFNVGSTDFDSVLTVYTKDDTDTYTEVGCNDDDDGTLSKLILTGQTASTTVYIRVWGYSGDRDPFELCAWDPTLPANDTPTTATALTVGSGTCSGNTAGDLTDATNSGVGGTPSCGEALGSDVWYTAEVPASGNLAIETFSSSDFDTLLTVYTKDDSDVYTEVACEDEGGVSNLSKVVLSGQTAGTTLYIRVWGYSGDRDSFEICAWEPSPAANDTPTAATALTVGSGTCSGNTAGDTTLATNSGVGGTPSCGINLGSDVWYTAAVPTSGNLVIETFDVGSNFDSVLTVYTKDDTDTYTEVACDDEGGVSNLSKVVLSGQTAGTTLYVRVWGYDRQRDPFEICAWEPPPANDTPDTATALTVGSGTCSGNTAGGATTSATNSGVGGTPSCGEGLGSDVWYTAVVPTSGNLVIETFNVDGVSFDSVLTIYTKDDTDTYTEVGCNDDDDDRTSSTLSKVVLSGQTAGTTLYIRVWGNDGDRDPFEICAWDPAPLSTSEIEVVALSVYPNPTTNILHINAQVSLEKAIVYSITGEQLLSSSLQQTPQIDVSALSTGLYLLNIIHEKGNQYIRFVKE